LIGAIAPIREPRRMGRKHLPLSSFEARPTAQALSSSHLRMTVQKSEASGLRSSRVDKFPTLTIFLVVLSMRGASRGVLEVGQSSGSVQAEPHAGRNGGIPARSTRRPARLVRSHRPGGSGSPSAATTSGCRCVPAGRGADERGRNLTPSCARKNGPEPKIAAEWQTAWKPSAGRAARRYAIGPSRSRAPPHAPCRRAPAPHRADFFAKLGLVGVARTRTHVLNSSPNSWWLFDIQIRTPPCPGQGAARSAKLQIRDPGSPAAKVEAPQRKPWPRICSAPRRFATRRALSGARS
jgi:hypothetical protein